MAGALLLLLVTVVVVVLAVVVVVPALAPISIRVTFGPGSFLVGTSGVCSGCSKSVLLLAMVSLEGGGAC